MLNSLDLMNGSKSTTSRKVEIMDPKLQLRRLQEARKDIKYVKQTVDNLEIKNYLIEILDHIDYAIIYAKSNKGVLVHQSK